MATKLDKLKACFAAGDEIGALRIAAKFPELGEHKDTITRGWNAYRSPDFYRQIGQHPGELFRAGIDAIKERYKL